MSCTTIDCILTKIKVEILHTVITILFVLATIFFLWGVIQYVIGSQGNEQKLILGKKVMLWGIIGLTIMASAWGIVKILCDFLDTCSSSSSSFWGISSDRSPYEEYRGGERSSTPSSSGSDTSAYDLYRSGERNPAPRTPPSGPGSGDPQFPF